MPELYEHEIKDNKTKKQESALAARLSARATRQYVGRKENQSDRVKGRSGMAYLGAAGWYIPVPTVLGALFGQWLDKHYPYNSVSWSLNFLLLGLAIGMLNMWFWLKREGIDKAKEEQELRDKVLSEVQQELEEKKEENKD